MRIQMQSYLKEYCLLHKMFYVSFSLIALFGEIPEV